MVTVACRCQAVFDRLTGRWALRVLLALHQNPMRFHALRDSLEAVSEKMLTQTLRHLERDGLVTRHVEPSIPPKVSYDLTALGRKISIPLQEVLECVGSQIADVSAAQLAYDARSRR